MKKRTVLMDMMMQMCMCFMYMRACFVAVISELFSKKFDFCGA